MNLIDLPGALAHFEEMARQLEGRTPAVFLDFDGTLAAIVERPDLTRISAPMKARVEALANICPVAIISGRERHVVEDLMGLSNVSYAGSHGFDISVCASERRTHQLGGEYICVMARLEDQITQALAHVNGVIIESKGVSLAVHYRLVAASLQKEVIAVAGEILGGQKGIKVLAGKMVMDILPDIDWDKGAAVTWLMEAQGLAGGSLAFFLGDDVTDEAAFAAVGATGDTGTTGDTEISGIGIFVASSRDDLSNRQTAAGYFLDGLGQVEIFLDRLTQAILAQTTKA